MIISIINHKGGTGKTSSVINIGAKLADLGYKVLLMDLDTQANLSQGLGFLNASYTLLDAINQKSIDIDKLETYKNLMLLTSNMNVSSLESTLIQKKIGGEQILKKLIKPIKDKFDFIIIDNPPSLGMTTLNALVASDSLIIPQQTEYFSNRGLQNILDFYTQVKEYYNPDLNILGIFLNQFDSRKKSSSFFKESLCEDLKSLVFKTHIRTNVAIPDSQLKGIDVFSYNKKANASIDFENLVNEILKKINK